MTEKLPATFAGDPRLIASKEELEKLNPFPFPGNVWVERRALHPRAVLRRGLRIKHLKRIAAADGAWDDALNVLAINRRGRRRFFWRSRLDWRSQGRWCCRRADGR